MNYNEFKDALILEIESRLLEEESVKIHEVTKNNGRILDGVIISNGDDEVMPTLYIQHLYEAYLDGESVENLADVVIDTNTFYNDKKPAADYFDDFNRIKGRLALKVVNTELNRAYLREVPHMDFLDLSILCFALVFSPYGDAGGAVVNNNLMEIWGISEDELFKCAEENTERLMGCTVMPLKEQIEDMSENIDDIKGTPLDSDCPAIILTNNYRLFGAANILNTELLDKCAEAFGGDFLIIPSSIHEILLTSMDMYVSREEIDRTIREVNELDDLTHNLSDHSYVYNSKKHAVEM